MLMEEHLFGNVYVFHKNVFFRISMEYSLQAKFNSTIYHVRERQFSIMMAWTTDIIITITSYKGSMWSHQSKSILRA